MKKILFSLLLIILAACKNNKKVTESSQKEKPNVYHLNVRSLRYDENYSIYTLEGCEYIVVDVGHSKWGSHKGNCKNPIHKNN
jgi:hypothetical protein